MSLHITWWTSLLHSCHTRVKGVDLPEEIDHLVQVQVVRQGVAYSEVRSSGRLSVIRAQGQSESVSSAHTAKRYVATLLAHKP
jgi:hypothetical protein